MINVRRSGSIRNVARARAAGVRQARDDAAKVAFHEAVERAPEDTGDLKSKIRLYELAGGEKVLESDSDHALEVEFGTSRMAAQPSFRPAVEEGRRVLHRELQQLRGRRG